MNDTNTSNYRGLLVPGIIAVGVGIIVAANKATTVATDAFNKVSYRFLYFKIADVVKGLLAGKINILLNYEIINENPVPVPSIYFIGSIFYEGKKIGDIQSISAIEVPANSKIENATLGFQLDIETLPDTIRELIAVGRFSTYLEVRGQVKTAFGTYSIPNTTVSFLPEGQNTLANISREGAVSTTIMAEL